jgi:hypothetical protein
LKLIRLRCAEGAYMACSILRVVPPGKTILARPSRN